MRMPPGATSLAALLLSFAYFLSALGSVPLDGASFGGSRMTTSHVRPSESA